MSKRDRDVEKHRAPRDVPPVGRPKASTWRTLQADGVVWEGQVALVGDDVDLAARMIVTHRRVVFARGGDVTLEIPREWLRPEPVLRRDGVLDLFVTMPGGNLFDEPMPVPIRMKEGHPAAGHIIAMLAPGGVRRILPESLSGMERAREAAPVPEFKGFWEEDDLDPSWESGEPVSAAADGPGRGGVASAIDPSDWLPVEPPDRLVRAPSTPASRSPSNGYAITGLQPKAQRKSPWGFLLRAVGLVLLLATAATLGAGRLNLGGSGDSGSEAILTGPSPTIAVVASPTAAPSAALAPEEEAAIAIGVGGAATQTDTTIPDSVPGTAQTQSPSSATTQPAAAIPTPAPTSSIEESSEAEFVATAATVITGAGAETAGGEDPSSATPDAPVVTQPDDVSADSTPDQVVGAGPLRIAVSSAQRAESLPRYGLPPGSGEWALLVIEVRNEGETPAAISMSDFRLFDREPGTTIALDSGTDVIAGLAGFDPPRSDTDEIAVEPGESSRALLLFLLPPGSSENVAFLIGETVVELDAILSE